MLEHATALVLEVGVSGFTIDELAKRSGVAKTTIYRHFPTRNELLVAALDGQIPTPDTTDTGTFRGDLVAFLTSLVPIFEDEAIRMVSLDLLALGAREPDITKHFRALASDRSTPLDTMIERGRRRGEVRDDLDPLTLLELIEGPMFMRSLMRPDQIGDFDIESHVDGVVQVAGPTG